MVYYSPARYNEGMFLVGLLSWWYGNGWRDRLQKTSRQLSGVAAFFSIGQLFMTLFSPFRQISAGSVKGSVDVQLRAWVDRQVSRAVGFFVRFFAIIAGIVTIILASVLFGIILIGWLVIPFGLIAGVIMTVIGWVPLWR